MDRSSVIIRDQGETDQEALRTDVAHRNEGALRLYLRLGMTVEAVAGTDTPAGTS